MNSNCRKISRRTFIASVSSLIAAQPLTLARPSLAQGSKVLKFIPDSDLAVLDPHWTPAAITRTHAHMVYDTLFGMDDKLQPRPQMAEGALSEQDGRVWRINLRPGLRFHDGERVLARDVVASLFRWSRRDVFGQTLYAAVDEVRALDDRTVEFRLSRPFPMLPHALGKMTAMLPAIMPERIAKTDAFTQITDYVGSGPFRFKATERVSGSLVVYDRNPDYIPTSDTATGTTAGPKRVHFDRVEWHVMPDSATAANAMVTGEMDWLQAPLHDLLPILKQKHLKIDYDDPSGLMMTMRMNWLTKPFDNPAIRRALLGAVNQLDFARAMVGDEANLSRSGVGLFCPNMPMANDAAMAVLTGPRNEAAVKQAIIDAGYDGTPVVLIGASDIPNVKNQCDVAADMMQKVGLKVDYQIMDWGSVVQRRASKNPLGSGGWSAYCSAWTGYDMLDPSSHQLLRGNESFAGWVKSEKLEKLRDSWFAAPDLASQQAVCRAIQTQALTEDVPYLPLGQYFQPTVYKNRLKGARAGMPIFWNVEAV